jgi:hypothetical protein
MDPVDAGYPRLYRAASLAIRPHADSAINFVTSGDYHDEHGLRVGRYAVVKTRDGPWGDRAAKSRTEVRDGDGGLFMIIVNDRREYVLADPDGTELATLRPHPQMLGRRLVVSVTRARGNEGQLRARRRQGRGTRVHDVQFSDTVAATITGHYVGNGLAKITLDHEADATPAQRCISLALATCLPRMNLSGEASLLSS